MPIKHQASCYRNKWNLHYICWGDFPENHDIWSVVKELKKEGYDAFYENHKDYYRVFRSENKIK